MREALFNCLAAASSFEGVRVLDVYAGTGALAFEALSRGAARATLVEASRPALDALRANAAALGVEQKIRVVAADVAHAARALAKGAPFDLVFADPPWALVDSGEAVRALEELIAAGLLSDSAIVVLEHAARSAAPALSGLDLDQTRRYGDTALAIYKPAILGVPRPERARPTSG